LRENLRVIKDVSENLLPPAAARCWPHGEFRNNSKLYSQVREKNKCHITQFLATDTRHTYLILRLVASDYFVEVSRGEECMIIPFLFTAQIKFTECDGNL
jgi:hypothetical protein